MLDKIEVLDKPKELNDRMQIVLSPRFESGHDVLLIEDLCKKYDDLLFEGFNMLLRRGEHVAIIGDNGTGKTTLLKIINGLVTADSGTVRLGTNVTIGYYDQEHHVLNDDNTIYDEISDSYPTLKETEIRNTLAAFLFTADDVYKRIESLSGGEKGRVSLAKLMLGEANLLILDEPTNHLDMASKEILEDAINNYTGTVLYVSHDRYFINRTADRILELDHTTFTEFLGDYDYYLEKKQLTDMSSGGFSGPNRSLNSSTNVVNNSSTKGSSPAGTGSAADDYKAMKATAAEEKRRKKLISESEEKISEYENRLSEIETSLSDPSNGTNIELLISLQKEHESLEALLEDEMANWERLSSAE
jgi:ATP-binding cassette subfamily F protein 3